VNLGGAQKKLGHFLERFNNKLNAEIIIKNVYYPLMYILSSFLLRK
jgi:hypothetical protein